MVNAGVKRLGFKSVSSVIVKPLFVTSGQATVLFYLFRDAPGMRALGRVDRRGMPCSRSSRDVGSSQVLAWISRRSPNRP